ncbi:MAG: nucleotide exchange factor GrpE [Propionibacteriaceae bacterium]|jgi:molecular chaperone GrpE|nr:nucleotide exchange factor GrpE [Propionibacteriaceae bacterium]
MSEPQDDYLGAPGASGAAETPGEGDIPQTDGVPTTGDSTDNDAAGSADGWDAAAAKLIAEAKASLAADGTYSAEDASRIGALEALLAERTNDLQRLQAEYINYKKRVDRDRMLGREQGAASVIKELVPIVDAVATAAEHEEITGGFKIVASEIERLATKLKLIGFGAVGDEFDPVLHEALMQLPTNDVPPLHVAQVIQRGYKLDETVVRPARVAVAVEPE